MSIVIIGWGSLVWDKRNLELKTGWRTTGPKLPVEFARISDGGKGRLTLVLVSDELAQVLQSSQTLWAESKCASLTDAIEQLRVRESNTRKSWIGHVNLASHQVGTSPIADSIAEWGKKVGNITDVIWTAIPSNFKDIRQHDLTEAAAVKYLCDLQHSDCPTFLLAAEYIRKAPASVQTPVRVALRKTFGKLCEDEELPAELFD